MIKTLLFDLDGTLIDCKELHFVALNLALKKHGFEPISREDHENKFDGLPTKVKLRELGYSEEEILVINDLKQHYTIKKAKDFIKPDQKVIEALRILYKQYELICVSNSVSRSVKLLLKRAELFDFFTYTLSFEQATNPKPAPDIYFLAKKLAQGECIAFEDNEKGLLSAKYAGIKVFPVIDSSMIRADYINNLIKYSV